MGFSRICIILLGVVFLISCSPSHDGSEDSNSNVGGITLNPNPDPALEAAAVGVFNTSCVSCHNGSQVPDLRESALDDLKESFYVNIGQGESSSVYTRMVNSGAPMPPAGLLATSESDIIRDWINDLGTVSEGSGGGVGAATFTEIETNILGPKCYSCHATASPVFGDYTSVLNLTVTPNNLDSVLYTSVTTGSSATGLVMPRNQPALTTEEIEAIESWILNGAPND